MRLFLLALASGVLVLGQASLEKYKQGHSHLGETFDTGPRQKPWEIAGTGDAPFAITHKNPEVQKWFNQGNALLHSFWYYEAERAFRWCLKLEPENAMAWWGLSRSRGGRGGQGVEFLKEAVARKGSVSARERLYIEADEADQLPPIGEKRDENAGKRVMERLVMQYPEDLEAKALLALRILGSDRVGAELLIRAILAKAPRHPGAHHYRIHNWDGRDPQYALESCAVYGDIAPDIGHARHMPGHIYASAGMWHEAAISMDAATRVEKQYMLDRQTFPFDNWNYTHNKNYLAYIQGQLGMDKAALSNARQLLAAPRTAQKNGRSEVFPMQMEAQVILLRTYVRYGRWKELLQAEQFEWDEKFLGNKMQKLYAETLAQIGLRELVKARKGFEALEALAEEVKKKDDYYLKSWHPLMVRELKAKLLLASGRTLEGLTELGAAAGEWGRMALEQGDPPYFPSNLYNDLGRAYVAAKSPELAVAAYEKSLEIVRNDGWALAGLAEVHPDRARAREYSARLLHVWGNADVRPVAPGVVAKDVSPGPQRNYAAVTMEKLGPNVWEPFRAPLLDALDPKRKKVTLDQFKGRNVLLIFYLGQECPHCLEQLQTAAKRKADFEKHNTVVLAISPNKPEDNADSLAIKELPFTLLSDDAVRSNAKRFLSFDDFEGMELHSTILIDAEGRERWATRGGDPFSDFDALFTEISRWTK